MPTETAGHDPETAPEEQIYLDHAATTPPADEAVAAMETFLTSHHENPSAIYADRAADALDTARAQVADLFETTPESIVFTGGGSEADSLAVVGGARANEGSHLITSTIEHSAIRNAADALEADGYDVTRISPREDGRVDPAAVAGAIREDTVLVSIMHANNETGVIQPIGEIGDIAAEHDVGFHSDTVQAVGKIPTPVDDLGVDLASLSAHKFYGPKGVGALYVRSGTDLEPVIHGGGQEGGLRGGTENVPGIVGMGRAAELALADREDRKERLETLRESLIDAIRAKTDGRLVGARDERLPGYATFCFPGHTGPDLVEAFADHGVAVSSGSACHSGTVAPSQVLTEMGIDPELALGAVRFTMGRGTTAADVAAVSDRLDDVLSAVSAE